MPRQQILEDHVVAVVGGNETADRESGLPGKESGGQVAEVAAGYGNDQFPALEGPGFLQTRHRIEIVKSLRKEPRHIDRVGRSQGQLLPEMFISESRFHQPLAVVESSVDFQGGDVPAQGRKLFFLDVAHLSGGIENDHVDALHPQEPVGHGAARVAGSGHQHGHRLVGSPQEVAEHPGHETGTYILEGQGGTMKQLQRPDVLRHPDYRAVKGEGFGGDGPQFLFRDILPKEELRHPEGDFRKGKLPQLAEKSIVEPADPPGHEQPVVGGQSGDDGLPQCHGRNLAIGAIIEHMIFNVLRCRQNVNSLPCIIDLI